MTSHIFMPLGMWDEVVTANTRARAVERAGLASRGRRPNVCGHYSSWQHYGHLMLGETVEAETLMDSCHGRMAEQPDAGELGYFLLMRARHVLDTEDWDLTSRWTIDPPAAEERLSYEFINTFAALREGNPESARALLAEGLKVKSPYQALHLDELRGLVAIADGNSDAGLGILREAAEGEDALPFGVGPPKVLKPTFELLGEELSRLGRCEESAAAYRRANGRNPGRTLSTRGLEDACEALNASSR